MEDRHPAPGQTLSLVEGGRPPRAGKVRVVFGRALFGLGALAFALVLAGQGLFLSGSLSGGIASVNRPTRLLRGTLSNQLSVVLSRSLGPSDRGARRFRILHIASGRGGKVVTITWAINNDLLGGTIGNGAQAEVYTVLQAIYGSHLPVALVRLYGTYPLAAGKPDSVVMRLSMDRKTAELVGSVGWDTLDPQSLWPLVRREYVNREFEPQSSE